MRQVPGGYVRAAIRADPFARVRTMIPLLLTGSALLIATGILQWTVAAENPLSAPFAACPYILCAVGVAIGVLAAGNIFIVRRGMNRERARARI